jgi:protein-L-isoaspartate(D-aspartate) O-methyltransferase
MARTLGDYAQAAQLRDAMTDKLLADGMIQSPEAERAFRIMPRDTFAPAGTPLMVAYHAGESIVTKTDRHSLPQSSVTAPFIQAWMIEQAQERLGMSVLEIGSGLYRV